MKIVFDIRPINAPIKSGIPYYTLYLLSALVKQNKNKHQFIFFKNSFRQNIKLNLNSHAKEVNLRIPNKLLTLLHYFFNAPKIDKLIPADIFYSFHLDALPLASNTKRILTIHDLSFVYFPKFFSWSKNIWHRLQKVESQLQSATKIIAVSQFTKETILEKYKINEDKVKVVYPGVTPFFEILEKNHPLLKSFLKKYQVNFPYVLNVGTLEPRKNHIGLIKAFTLIKTKKQFKDLKLIIVGQRGWKYQQILKCAKENSFCDDIIFWHNASQEDLLCLYNMAEVFVYPSFFEGFGFPPLEAQKTGIPVIASLRTSLPEILKNSALLVDPFKIHEIASAIEVVLTNSKLKSDLIAKGLLNVVNFKWEKTAKEVLATIEELQQ